MSDKKEYIERGALRNTLLKSKNDNTHHTAEARLIHAQEHNHLLNLLENTPASDVVEVVRCEKCLFNGYVQSDGVIHCARESVMGTGTVFRKATDYCSYGVRKDGADSD